jgi:hypothetical protein
VRIYDLGCPSSVIAGLPFQIGFRAAVAEEDQPACRTVQLTINGQPIETVEACLPWQVGTMWVLSHYFRFSEITLSEPGIYEISVDGLTATLKVIKPADILIPVPTTELWDLHNAAWLIQRVEDADETNWWTIAYSKVLQKPNITDIGCAFTSLEYFSKKLGYRTWWKAILSYPIPGPEDSYWRFSLIYIPQEWTSQYINTLWSNGESEGIEGKRKTEHLCIETASTSRLEDSAHNITLGYADDVTKQVLDLANFFPDSERNQGIVERIESRIPNAVVFTTAMGLLIYQTLGKNWITFHSLSPSKLEGIEPNVISFECDYFIWPGSTVPGWLNLRLEAISGRFDVIWLAALSVYHNGKSRGFQLYGWKVGEANLM